LAIALSVLDTARRIATPEGIELALRLAGLYWKERALHAFRVASHEGAG
jgi:hypothetical protein